MIETWLKLAPLAGLLAACSQTPPAASSLAAAPPTPVAPASAPPATSAAPPPAQGPSDQLEVAPRPDFDEYRKTPAAVEVEKKHLAESYTPFEKITRLPDFLSVNAVLALYPEPELRETLRTEIHSQMDGSGGGALLGAWLDDEQQYYALWLAQHLSQVLAVYHRGRLTQKKVVSRGQEPLLRDIIPEENASRLEIAFEHITTMSVCCLPSSFDVYRVSDAGGLLQVFSFPKSHVQVGPGVRWDFLNHFEFSGTGVVVSQVYPESPARYEFVYGKGSNRYEPTPATSKLLREERVARERELRELEGGAPQAR